MTDQTSLEGTTPPEYKDRSLYLKGIGLLLFVAGLACLYIGPLEMHVFYLFSDGGRFHYEGFGFGTFMFANIAVQVAGYYLIGVTALIVGYGHLRLKRWIRKTVLTLSVAWLIAGIPLLFILALMTFSVKEMSVVVAGLVVVLLAASYLVVPWVLIRFYQGRNVRLTLETYDSSATWIETFPTTVLVVGVMALLVTLALHVLILVNGLFPVFGHFVTGLDGIYLLDIAIMCLGVLTWGLLKLKSWAWWGSVLYFIALGVTSVLTLIGKSAQDLLLVMNLPAKELEFLAGLQFGGNHIAILVALPLLATVGILIYSRRHFS